MEVTMNYTEQKAIAQNFKVLAGLRDLCQLLNEHGAVIGRDGARIVVDLDKAPSIMLDEMGEIFRTSQLVAPNGIMRIFDNAESDNETGVLLLNISISLKSNDTNYAQFHYFNEVRELLESIPLMTQEQSKAFEALHEALEARLIAMMPNFREALIEGLFGGDDSPNWTHDEKGKTLH